MFGVHLSPCQSRVVRDLVTCGRKRLAHTDPDASRTVDALVGRGLVARIQVPGRLGTTYEYEATPLGAYLAAQPPFVNPPDVQDHLDEAMHATRLERNVAEMSGKSTRELLSIRDSLYPGAGEDATAGMVEEHDAAQEAVYAVLATRGHVARGKEARRASARKAGREHRR